VESRSEHPKDVVGKLLLIKRWRCKEIPIGAEVGTQECVYRKCMVANGFSTLIVVVESHGGDDIGEGVAYRL
jgi:hypothetical protein